MRDEFEKMVSAGKLETRHVSPLVTLAENGYCHHKSWGFGRITTVDTVFGRFVIDFPGKSGHHMDLAFAAESLRSIPKDHILARKAADLESLRQMAGKDHVKLVRIVVNSFGGRATVEQIQQALVPDVIRDDWKKWWETAKRDLKKDGHFLVPIKKTEPVICQDQEVSLQERLLGEFRAAKGLKAHLTVGAEILKSGPDLEELPAAAKEVIATLNPEIVTHQRTQPAVALDAIFVRDDLREMAKLPVVDGELSAASVWGQDLRFSQVMELVPALRHRRVLESFKASNPETWVDVIRSNFNTASAKLCKEFAAMLIQDGKLDQLKATLARLISQHGASTELLLWLAKDRSDVFADILGPEVFRAMLSAMERDLFNEKRSGKLRDFIVSEQELLPELIESADLEVVKDLTRALQLSAVFDDERDRRSLLARILKVYPAMQSLISGDQTKQEAVFHVSWESLTRRRSEYEELVHKKIPANSKEIAIARSYGDLSENHEYKAAKEMQKVLMHRKHELEVQLARARGTDFAGARTDIGSPGTIVHATDLDTGHSETYQILGAWDSDPDHGVLSYLTPMAQAFIGHKPGEEVGFELDTHRRRFRIVSIEAYNKAPVSGVPGIAPETPPAASPA